LTSIRLAAAVKVTAMATDRNPVVQHREGREVNGSMRALVLILCLSSGLIVAGGHARANDLQTPPQAEPPWISEVRFGLVDNGVPLVSRHRKEHGIGPSADVLLGRPTFSLWSGVVRPIVGGGINSDRDGTDRLYGALLWGIEKSPYFLDLGLGLAVHDGQLHGDDPNQKYYGSRVLFYGQVDAGYSITYHHRLSFFFDHMSNAYLAEPNNGLNTIGIRYCYRF
jgi:lipid A 3-O-deacylase